MNYAERRSALVEYLKVKTQECDWHAVSDAANDLRVLEARHENDAQPVPYRTCVHAFRWVNGAQCPYCKIDNFFRRD